MPNRRRRTDKSKSPRPPKSPSPRQTVPWHCYGCEGLIFLPHPTKEVYSFQVPTLQTVDGDPRPFCDTFCYVGSLFQNDEIDEPGTGPVQ